MRHLLHLALLPLIAAGLGGCLNFPGCDNHHGDRDDENRIMEPVVFEYEYINHAWGYRHHGFYIENDGHIRGYNMPKEWKETDSTGTISASDVKFNISQCDSLYGKVDKEDLLYHFGLLEDAGNGKIRELPITMADAGVGTLYGYYLDPHNNMMQRVFLACNGDVNKENITSAARMITTWLIEVGQSTDRFFWFKGD